MGSRNRTQHIKQVVLKSITNKIEIISGSVFCKNRIEVMTKKQDCDMSRDKINLHFIQLLKNVAIKIAEPKDKIVFLKQNLKFVFELKIDNCS
jgi:hypothetical protein